MENFDTRMAEEFNLNDTPTGTEEFNPVVTQPQADTPPNYSAMISEYYSQALTRPQEDIEAEVLRGMESIVRREANAGYDATTQENIEARMAQAFENEEDPQSLLNDIIASTTFGNLLSPQITAYTGDGQLNGRNLRQLDRIVRAEELIAKKMEQSKAGVAAGVGYFADIAVSDPIHSIIGSVLAPFGGAGDDTFEEGAQRVELARQLSDLVVSDIPADQFEQEFNAILDRIGDAGMFSDSNPFYLQEFIDMAKENGQGITSDMAVAFQVLDTATAGLSALKGVARTGAVPRVVAKLRGQEAGVNSRVRQMERGNGPALAENEPHLTRVANEDDTYLSAPELEARRVLESRNAALKIINDTHDPSMADPNLFKRAQDDLTQRIREQHGKKSTHEIDIRIVRTSLGDNIVGQVVLGTSRRTPYKTIEKAQEVATRIGAEVRETVDNGKKAYVVVKEYNIDARDLVEATDLGEISSGILTSITSTTRNTTSYLDGLLKWGEANNARNVREINRMYNKAVSQTSRQNRAEVNAIYRELRDDPNYSNIKRPYTKPEFIERYTNKFNGKGPNEQTLEYWAVLQDLSDADYLINADRILKEAVENGETMVRLDGTFFRAKKVKPESGESVYDIDLGKMRAVRPDEEAFLVNNFEYTPVGATGPVQYVTGKNLVTRRLFHSDVMSYNVGGHRTYADKFEYIMKQEGDITLADGRKVDTKPKAWMGVRTEAEARIVKDQYNTIARAMADDEAAVTDEFVRANTKWHHGIETKDDFIKFAEDQNLSPTKEVDFAADGEALLGQGNEVQKFAGEGTVGSAFRTSLNNRARSAKPLLGFGGDSLETIDPSAAMEKGLAYSLNREAHSQYLNRASRGLLYAIRKLEAKGESHVKNWADLGGMSPEQMLRNVEFKATSEGRKMGIERDTILRLLDRATPDQLWERRKLNVAATYVYGKKDTIGTMVGKKNADRLSKTVDGMADLDYPGFIRSVAFHTKLGMLSVDQFMVQASQSINATAIASANLGATGAVRAVAGAHPLQLALAGSDAVAERIARSQAAVTGISAEDFMELRKWVNETGRGVVDRTVMEENRDAFLGAGRRAQLSNISTAFFRYGEVNARMGAAMLNVAELRKSGYKGSLFRQDITQKMFSRQDTLTASMTAASSAGWQRGALAIPLQFMTYNMRILEQMFSPDVLSKAERIRLGVAHLTLYGAASTPLVGALVDKYGYTNGIDPNDGLYHAVRYGAMDAALSQLIEAAGGTKKSALSTRIGIGDGMFQFVEETGTQGLIELAIGPGGQIINDSIGAMGYVLSGLFSESHTTTEYDLNRLGRIVSSYDDAFKFWAAKNYGDYWTRTTGTVTMNGMNSMDGFFQAMGIPLAANDQLWADIGNESNRKAQTEKVYKTIEELSRVAARQYEQGEYEDGHEVIDDINFLIMGLKPGERATAVQRLRRIQDLPDVIERQLLQRGQLDLANRMRNLSQ